MRRTSKMAGPAVGSASVTGVTSDPLAPLAELPGVAAAGEEAREALGRAHRHRTNLRGWPATAAEAALRAARASSVLDGGSLQLPETGEPDPVLAGALRVSEALEGGATRWSGSGRRRRCRRWRGCTRWPPRTWSTTTGSGVRGPTPTSGRGWRCWPTRHRQTRVPATVLAAVAHGELLTLAPFGTADGRGRAWGVAVGDDRQRAGPARSRRARGVLDAPFRRLPRRRARIRVRHARRSGGVVGAQLRRRCAPARGRRCRSRRPPRSRAVQQSESGRRSETGSARRPLARTPVTKRAVWGCVGGLGVLAMRYGCNPTQRVVVVVRSSQLRRPATLLPIPRHVLRVGAGIRAG